ncbi:hypothetical protein [Pseudomonas sp.]|jgi:hypothetical protein|uniref:hypothetical protein n=1 Tax=Pseudomonas sp. TaxID=306 RepID=UPI002EDBA632
MQNQTDTKARSLATRIVAYCADRCLTLGGLVSRIQEAGTLTCETAKELTTYCDQVQCLTLGGLVDEVWTLREAYHAPLEASLEVAHLNYGATVIHVKPSDLLPLPPTFDFDNAEQCARTVFAVMSNASGGFALRDCKVRIDIARKRVNLTASGCHVFYAPTDRQKLPIEEAIRAHQQATVLELGSVSTDQYGEGWKRAVWS